MITSEQIAERVLGRMGILATDPIPIPDPIAWIQDNFYLYDTGELIDLIDCQIRPLQKAFERDENGRYCYNTVLWSWPKKSAKSSVIAAVCDYVAEHTPRASIKLIANDLKQADSRVGMYVRENIRHAQRRGKRQGIVITPSGYRINYPNGSIIECVPIDPSGEAGGNDDIIVYSELWGWKHTAHQRMWSEMTLSPTKFGKAQRWIDTYAGFTGESPILEGLYKTGVRQGRLIWDDLEVYENQPARLLTTWVTKPMFHWQTEDYYQEQSNTLTPDEFLRMHRNQFVSSEEAFVPIEWWESCKTELPGQYTDLVVGIDAAVSGDCFGIVAVSGHEGRRCAVRYVRKWTPPLGGKLDFSEPEAEIRRLAADNQKNVVAFVYDPYQLHDLTTRLRNEGVGWFKEFPQGQDRLIADKALYDMIRERRIMHSGEIDLRDHIRNANSKTENEKLRIVKRADNLKIDLAVALSMAAAIVTRWHLE